MWLSLTCLLIFIRAPNWCIGCCWFWFLMLAVTWGLSRGTDGNDLFNDNVLITRHQIIIIDTPLSKKGSIRTLQNISHRFLYICNRFTPLPYYGTGSNTGMIMMKKRAFVLHICESKDLGSKCNQLEWSCCESTLEDTYLGISSLRCRLLDRSITTSGPTICQRHFQ